MCRCTLLPHCYTQIGDSGTLACSHHPADSQVTEPELSTPAEDRVRGPSQASPPLGGSAVSGASGATVSIQSEDKLVSEAADMERKDGEETRTEGADSPAAGRRSGDPSGSPDPLAPAVADAAVVAAESCGPAHGQQAVTQWPQEPIGESGPARPVCPWLRPGTAPPWLRPSYFAVSYLILCVNI